MASDHPKRISWLRRALAAPRNLSMATWLAVAVLLVTISSLVVTSILSLTYGQDLASGLADSQLAARASTKAEEVTRYLTAMQRRTAAIATSSGTADAVERFSTAYGEVAAAAAPTVDESAELVAGFYRDEFAPALEESIGIGVGWRSMLPTSDDALHLQRYYVVDVDGDTRGLVDDAGDGSSWSEVHQELHLGLLEVANRMGAADLYLVEPESGVIVYSAAKKPDFATSLDVGPHSGSTLATAMRAVREAPEHGPVVVDMAPHTPDLGAPMVFMAAPVLEGDRLSGILILKFSGEPLDAIMTSEQNWQAEGFGDTGETFLVGADGRMRSVSRPFLEDADGLLEALASAGTASSSEQSAIEGVGTTAIFLKAMDTRDLADARVSSGETAERTNYLLRPVLSSVDPIEFGDLEWYVVAEREQDEVAGPIGDFRRDLLVAVAVFVIGIAFATVGWARSVFRPIRSISDKLHHARDNQTIEEDESMARAPTDFADLSANIDGMLDSLRRREEDLISASEERLRTVRSLLPPAIVERVESGDRNVVDHIPQAGIVVVATEGLGDLVQRPDVAGTQELLGELISEVDAAAVHHGLERVKLIGDAYYAGCGLSQPYLDHVPRSVAFALDVRDIVAEVSSSRGIPLRTAAGIHSGPVTVGLTGSMRLVYDLWGETVRVAHFLARRAQAGEILVSSEVQALLPSDISVTTQPDTTDGPPVYSIIGHQVPEESQS